MLVNPARASHWIGALGLALLLALGICGGRHADPDMWHELSLAREIVAERAVPWTDAFAYTPTVVPCVHHEWGTGLALHAAISVAGESGVLLVGWGLAALLAALCVLAARRSGASPPVLLALAPIAMFLSWIGFSFVRAQMFSLVFLATILLGLQADRRGDKRWFWPWLFAHLVWLNLHAGFVVGMLLLALHTLETALERRPVKHLLALLGVELALVAVNPWGWRYFAYLARALTMSRPSIGEWAPVTSAFLPIALMWGFSLVLALYALSRRGWKGVPGITLVLAAAVASGMHQRHLSLYAVAWIAHVPGWIEETPLGAALSAGWERRPRLALAATALLGLGAAVGLARAWHWRVDFPANPGEHPTLLYPAGAVDQLERTGFGGNLFVPFTVGAYVTYRLHPRVLVSIDGRYEVAYPPGSLERVQRIQAAEGEWEKDLLSLGTDAVLATATSPLARELRGRAGWQHVYADDAYDVFIHSGESAPLEDRRGQRIAASFPSLPR